MGASTEDELMAWIDELLPDQGEAAVRSLNPEGGLLLHDAPAEISPCRD